MEISNEVKRNDNDATWACTAACFLLHYPEYTKSISFDPKKKKERGKYWGKKERKNKEVVGGLPHRPRL